MKRLSLASGIKQIANDSQSFHPDSSSKRIFRRDFHDRHLAKKFRKCLLVWLSLRSSSSAIADSDQDDGHLDHLPEVQTSQILRTSNVRPSSVQRPLAARQEHAERVHGGDEPKQHVGQVDPDRVPQPLITVVRRGRVDPPLAVDAKERHKQDAMNQSSQPTIPAAVFSLPSPPLSLVADEGRFRGGKGMGLETYKMTKSQAKVMCARINGSRKTRAVSAARAPTTSA